jgi:hypothetical protein
MFEQSAAKIGEVTPPVVYASDDKVPLTEMLGIGQELVFRVNSSYKFTLDGQVDVTLSGDDFEYLRHALPFSERGQMLKVPDRKNRGELTELGQITSVRWNGDTLDLRVKKSVRAREFRVSVDFEGVDTWRVRSNEYRSGVNASSQYPMFE